jgi:hypothetical protein
MVQPTSMPRRPLALALLLIVIVAGSARADGSPPVIASFTSTRGAVGSVAPWTSDFLHWSVSGATTVTIDHGIGDVTATPYSTVTVSPTAPTRYTLTATNASGSVTASLLVGYLRLVQLAPDLYQTEHALYLIPSAGQATFPDYSSVFSWTNIDTVYVPRLQAVFPADYFMVVVTANGLQPNNVPIVTTRRHVGDGIGLNSITGVGVPNICRYNAGGGTTVDFSVFDHEIGHNWSAFVGIEVGSGHWYWNSTSTGQMAATYTDDDWTTVKTIGGTPATGFTWVATDNSARNETETFGDQDLYAMGLAPTFPDTYVLGNAVFNADHTMSSTSATLYGHAWLVGKNGPRVPGYQSSEKQFRLGFVYIARDVTEIQNLYFDVERAIAHFENADAVDTVRHRFQVPFLVETKFRASVNARLADLDGNHAPTLALTGPSYVVSTDGAAAIPFAAADADGEAPVVSVLPETVGAAIVGSQLVLQGLPPGTYFFTLQAADSLGKKAFAHLVVDVVQPDALTFVTRTGVAPGTVATSNDVTPAGIAAGTPVSIVGGSYSINGRAFTTENGVVGPGDSVRVRLDAPATNGTRTAARLLVGHASGAFTIRTSWPAAVLAATDYDGDGKSDVAVYRAPSGTWFSLDSSVNNQAIRYRGWGVESEGDVPVPGDYDGDGIIDPAVFRPATGTWFVLESETGFSTWNWFGWGQTGDVPAAGDYDGDGRTDAAVYRPSSGTWFVRPSGGGPAWSVVFGQAGDVALAGDFDGDGKRDPAVYRASTGTWFWLESSTGLAQFAYRGWGSSAEGDVPAPGDYDGDGKTDLCVFRPGSGTWLILESHAGWTTWNWFGWGQAGDALVPGDYDGDGRTDASVYRPTTGTWYIRPSGGASPWSVVFGETGDTPLPARR